jgi:hypothetical protein
MAEILEYFHCNEVYQLLLDDDYFKGIRANTFCIEVGWSECYTVVTECPTLYIVTANHKGIRRMVMCAADEQEGG